VNIFDHIELRAQLSTGGASDIVEVELLLMTRSFEALGYIRHNGYGCCLNLRAQSKVF
jgi:hypothetical protein